MSSSHKYQSRSHFMTQLRPHLKRVVVTGIGAVTPLGLSMEETWKNALSGKSGISRITKFDCSQYDVQIAGEVKNFNADLYIEKKDQKRMELFTQYAVACSKMAVEDAQLKITDEVAEQTGVIIGAGMGGLPIIEEQVAKILDKGPSRVSPFYIPMAITNMAAGHVTMSLGLKGGNFSVTSACATGAHSIGVAVDNIRLGRFECMLAGGVESTVCPSGIAGFAAMRALSTRNAEPERASRPWDKERDGFVLAEGGTVLVLESLDFALARGAKIICEITGFGMTSDAYHMTNPAPEGIGAQNAMRMALRDAGLMPQDINYINAHGTSTPVGDGQECLAIKRVFEDHSKNLLVSSTKSMMGHTLGAAGAIEGGLCALAIRDQIVPPTINLENPSPECDLDLVPGKSRKISIQHVLKNSFGFGGTNACLIFSRYTP